MIRADLFRFSHTNVQVLGTLTFYDGAVVKGKFSTLELAWKENKNMVSCISEGTYKVIKRWSNRFGEHWHITDVPNRTFILIHAGNFHTEINGCVLVGTKHQDVNADGFPDVVESRKAMTAINDLLKEQESFELRIFS